MLHSDQEMELPNVRADSPSDLQQMEGLNEVVNNEDPLPCGYSDLFIETLQDRLQSSKKRFTYPKNSTKKFKKKMKYFWQYNKDRLSIENGVVIIEVTQHYKVYSIKDYKPISEKEFKKLKNTPNKKCKLSSIQENRKLLPQAQAVQIFKHCHNTSIGHRGINVVENSILREYYAPNIRRFIVQQIQKCGCKIYKQEKRINKRRMKRRQLKMPPLTFWRIDCMGPFRVSAKKNKYIITARDEISKVCQLKPVPAIGAAPTWNFIQERIIGPFGSIKILGSDNGTEFRNGLLSFNCKDFGIEQEFITAGRSQSNGGCERLNRDVNERLREQQRERWGAKNKQVDLNLTKDKYDAHWDERIFEIQFGINSCKHSAIGTAPWTYALNKDCKELIWSKFNNVNISADLEDEENDNENGNENTNNNNNLRNDFDESKVVEKENLNLNKSRFCDFISQEQFRNLQMQIGNDDSADNDHSDDSADNDHSDDAGDNDNSNSQTIDDLDHLDDWDNLKNMNQLGNLEQFDDDDDDIDDCNDLNDINIQSNNKNNSLNYNHIDNYNDHTGNHKSNNKKNNNNDDEDYNIIMDSDSVHNRNINSCSYSEHGNNNNENKNDNINKCNELLQDSENYNRSSYHYNSRNISTIIEFDKFPDDSGNYNGENYNCIRGSDNYKKNRNNNYSNHISNMNDTDNNNRDSYNCNSNNNSNYSSNISYMDDLEFSMDSINNHHYTNHIDGNNNNNNNDNENCNKKIDKNRVHHSNITDQNNTNEEEDIAISKFLEDDEESTSESNNDNDDDDIIPTETFMEMKRQAHVERHKDNYERYYNRDKKDVPLFIGQKVKFKQHGTLYPQGDFCLLVSNQTQGKDYFLSDAKGVKLLTYDPDELHQLPDNCTHEPIEMHGSTMEKLKANIGTKQYMSILLDYLKTYFQTARFRNDPRSVNQIISASMTKGRKEQQKATKSNTTTRYKRPKSKKKTQDKNKKSQSPICIRTRSQMGITKKQDKRKRIYNVPMHS